MQDKSEALRILIVDDSPLYRTIIREAISEIADVEIVGLADNGEKALAQIESLKPDVITLDVEMPVLDGLGVLEAMQQTQSDTDAIMLSSLTRAGAQTTMMALARGAFDFILKPSEGDFRCNVVDLRSQLVPRLELLKRKHFRGSNSASSTLPELPGAGRACLSARKEIPEVVVIGISTGGPAALTQMLPSLPVDFPVPILIVQHMPAVFTHSLAEDLDRLAAIDVCEARSGERLQPGTCFIAPGGKHMKLIRTSNGVFTRITDAPPEFGCRPSANYLFRSAGECFGPNVLALVMTGMGEDGLQGCQDLNRRGSTIWTQDQESCVVYGMPRQVVDSGIADRVLPLANLADALTAATRTREYVL